MARRHAQRPVQAQMIVLARRSAGDGTLRQELGRQAGVRMGDLGVQAAGADAGRGLAGNGQAAGTSHGAGQRDGAADVKNDNAVAAADGGAERTRAAIGQGGDVIDRAGAAAGGIRAETERAGKGRSLGLGAQRQREQEQK